MKNLRLHDDLVDNSKLQELSPELFKYLINLWCLASQNGGYLPDATDIADRLQEPLRGVQEAVTALAELGLLERSRYGCAPVNQSASPGAMRVRRHRAKKKADKDNEALQDVTEMLHNVTRMLHNVTDNPSWHDSCVSSLLLEPTTNVTNSISFNKRKSVTLVTPDGFDEFWKIYPRRQARRTAEKAFRSARKRANLDKILEGARVYAGLRRGKEKEFTLLGSTWLNGDRWDDERETSYQPLIDRPHEEPVVVEELTTEERVRRVAVLKQVRRSLNKGAGHGLVRGNDKVPKGRMGKD